MILAKHYATNITINRHCDQHNHWDWHLTSHHLIVALNHWEVTVKTMSEGGVPSNEEKFLYYIDNAVITIWLRV